MSIKSYVTELEEIRFELKKLNQRGKVLRKKAKEIEANIADYLEEKNQPGVKYNGTAVIVEEKETHLPKKKKDALNDALSVLKSYGISDPEIVFKEMMDARKGEITEKRKVNIKKYKQH